MATVYEIIQGLSQAAANAYDGALGEDMSPTPTGVLRREEGDALAVEVDGFIVGTRRYFDSVAVYARVNRVRDALITVGSTYAEGGGVCDRNQYGEQHEIQCNR